jgi:hypothetical protein
MRSPISILIVWIFLLPFLVISVFPTTVSAASRRGGDVQIFSLQILVNQAYQMALEGAGLVIVDQMGKGGIFGGLMGKRGWIMIDQGQSLISRSLDGEEMKQLEIEGDGDNPLTVTVRENARMMLEGIGLIRDYLGIKADEPNLSRMHSLFILLNHGMKMSTDGVNMILLGRSGETGSSRDLLQKHGRNMVKDARIFIIRLSDNETMKALHSAGHTPSQDKAMGALHKSIGLSLQLINRLARM